MPRLRIGIDLGGTKIETVAMDEHGSFLVKRRISTPRNDYAATLQAIADLVESIEEELAETASVGIGMPGSISTATGLVKNANSTWLNGKCFREDLTAMLARQLRFENDANCFALSEARDGAAKGARLVFGVIIGTGTGGGIVLDGSIWQGPHAIAGEWGHNPLPAPHGDELPGPDCYCGRSGCIETFISGTGLSRDYKNATGKQVDAVEIADLAQVGDTNALQSLKRYEDRLARGLASVINLLDPEVIVLGGGMSNIKQLYTSVPLIWERYIFSDTIETQLVAPTHGDSSGVRGAAWLWD